MVLFKILGFLVVLLACSSVTSVLKEKKLSNMTVVHSVLWSIRLLGFALIFFVIK